jgi:predicted ferric reductase
MPLVILPLPKVTGTLLLIVLILMIPATHQNIKRGQFEIFWFTHNLWPVFAALCFFHGNNWWGPNYWKFFLFPGGLYVLERIYREVSRRVPARLKSVTIMDNPKVCSLAFCKAGPFEPLMQNGVEVPAHREGQYAYICCPHVSEFEWHPMTISAAPHEEYVTFHIRVQGPKSWTAQMTQYMMDLAGNAVYKEHSELNGKKEGRTLGIDGKPLFLIDGPHSAPTQHLTQYQDVMVCATGIGITPLAATLKSVVHGIWPRSSGMAYPSNANFYWVCSYQDVPSFKWFLRTIREVTRHVVHIHADISMYIGVRCTCSHGGQGPVCWQAPGHPHISHQLRLGSQGGQAARGRLVSPGR